MSDFAKMLKKGSTVEKFKDAIEKESAKGFTKDEDFWQPTVDAAGNGFAVIRFLPTPPQDGDDGLPWVKYFSHGFQGPTGLWYIENSLTTLGKDDPVSEYNSKLWATGVDANKDIARAQKRKLTYVSNILVVSDPKKPECEGKVFKYKYGKKIFEKIDESMNPAKYDQAWNPATDKPAIDPFHFLEGANFKLKIRKYEGYRNYDKSEFDNPTALFGGDAKKLEDLWNQEFSLKALIAPDKFKDYATLKLHLDKVLGIDTSTARPLGTPVDDVETHAPVRASTAEGVVLAGSDDDDHLFENLARPE